MEFSYNTDGGIVSASYPDELVESVFLPLLCRLSQRQKEENRRILVFLAAPPAAGKSTLAAFLQWLSRCTPGVSPIQAIGMDGFHHHQPYLLTHTTVRNGTQIPMVRIKGAPITFDLNGLTERIARVAAGEVTPWPVYHRELHDSIDGEITVDGSIVLLEGNYLLLDRPGWCELKGMADYTVFISAPRAYIRERLIARKTGINGYSRSQAEEFVDFSDLPNADEITLHSVKADLNLALQPDGSYIKE